MTFIPRITTRIVALVAAVALLAAAAFATIGAGSPAVAQTSDKNIVETAAAAGQFKTLVSLAKKAGLAGALSGDDKLTVFAPTDAAFRKVPKKTLDKLARNKALLKSVLLYHVVSGNVKSPQVVKLRSAKTLNGKSVRISVRGGKVYLNRNSRVTKVDVAASNGTIHVINRVLMPPSSASAASRRDDDDDKGAELEGGKTSLAVDPGSLAALSGAGFAVAPIGSARASQGADGNVSFAFPISGGWLDPATLAGKIRHRGGLTFSRQGTTVGVKHFSIDTARAVLTAKVVGTKTRIPLLDLDLSAVQASVSEERASVSGVRATLTGEAAAALNGAFDTGLFAEGLAIGNATVDAEIDD